MEIKWVNGLHKQDNMVFDSRWEAEEWADSVYTDLAGFGFGYVGVGYATPDEKVARYLAEHFPKWLHSISNDSSCRSFTVHSETENIDGRTIYKVWTEPI
ncbi:hypothetical protein [Alicyclobacillus fastidiosus]|uniref:Uncharacterized protein n=1 Tax=Alicyclobacillus fastidiosus TaxID=392011 RepID=A0ABV5AHF7_9BACL|nr:hypothetical protein [Alicyclobacillus fastidiosus]WEH09185.1 hypothetical protein PYS47_21335 [Alicyclobacillus fastidiosus]